MSDKISCEDPAEEYCQYFVKVFSTVNKVELNRRT